MSEVKKRRVHSAEFKAKVGMEAVRGVKTAWPEIAAQLRQGCLPAPTGTEGGHPEACGK